MSVWDPFSRQVYAGGTGVAGSAASPTSVAAAPARTSILVELGMFVVTGSRPASSQRMLEPGETYRVRVTLARREGSGATSPHCFQLFEDTLCLRLESCDWSGLIVHLAPESPHGREDDFRVVSLTREELDKPRCVEFLVTVPEDCPYVETRLKLDCHEPGGFSADQSYELPSESVRLNGRHHEATDEQKGAWNIPLDAEIPENWAILHIIKPDDRLRLSGWSRSRPLRQPLELEQLHLEERDFIANPAEIIDRIFSYSDYSMGELQRWFEELLARNPDDLVLIVIEQAETHMPWEMVRLDDGYLGSRAEVVRWLVLEHRGRRWELSPGEERCSGHVLAFLDKHTLAETQNEDALLDRLGSLRLTTPDELVRRLHERRVEGVGLVYFGCHGVVRYGESGSVRYIKLGELTNPSDQVLDLKISRVRPLPEKIPLVLANACHSGRLYRDERGWYGLPLIFLNIASRSYVGTLGPVDDLAASKIGAELLRRLRDVEDTSKVSKILRELRMEAAASFDILTDSYEEQLEFLSRFMYVYYGNPRTHLRLESAPGEELSP